jgi:glycosyltransferase involved in cell wall biosynthesis
MISIDANFMTQHKKILHFIESEDVYGAERVILNLSKELQKTNAFDPVVGCIVSHATADSPLYNAAQKMGLSAIKIPISNKKILWQIPAAAKIIKNVQIDLIHSHGYKPSVFGFIIRLLTGIPIIATCHLWFEPAKAPLKTKIMLRLEIFFYRWFPKVVGVSQPIVDILQRNKLKGEAVELIKNGVEVPEPISADQIRILRAELNLGAEDFCILNTARLTKQKGQWNLIKAAALLKERNVPCKILIVGDGPLLHEFEAMIQQESVSECVFLLGFRKDIPALLQLCDAFALPSIDEGMPMSLLEAAASGKAIVSTLVGDIAKIIKEGVTGLVIPTNAPLSLANAIETLRNNPALAEKLANNVKDILVREYSSQAMCSHYVKIYRHVLNEK